MKSAIGICGAIVLVIATLSIGNAGAAAPASREYQAASFVGVATSTDLGAKRRGHRHHSRGVHSRGVKWPPAYYARPYYYRPAGMAPFFPFYHGYGFDPSW